MIKNMTTASALMTAALLWAGNVSAQSLEDALISAYLTNPTLNAQRAAVRAADESVPQALSGYRPSATLEGGLTGTQTSTDLSDSSRASATASLRLSQTLYDGGLRGARLERAENSVLLSRAQLHSGEQDILLGAVQAYNNVRTARSVLELTEANETRLEKQRRAAKDRFSVGEVTRTDVAQAEARLARAVADRFQAIGDIRTAEANYQDVIGRAPGSLLNPMIPKDLPGSLSETVKLALDQHPSVVASQHALKISEDDVDSAKAGLMPTVSLNGSLSYTTEPSSQLDRQTSGSIGANVSLPLYRGGNTYSTIRQSMQTVQQRKNERDAAVRQVEAEAKAAWETLTAAQARLTSVDAQIRAAKSALDGVQQEALVGSRTTLDVLDAEQELFDAEIDAENARRDVINAAYRLKASIGELTAEQLALNVDIYDVSQHYQQVRQKLYGTMLK